MGHGEVLVQSNGLEVGGDAFLQGTAEDQAVAKADLDRRRRGPKGTSDHQIARRFGSVLASAEIEEPAQPEVDPEIKGMVAEHAAQQIDGGGGLDLPLQGNGQHEDGGRGQVGHRNLEDQLFQLVAVFPNGLQPLSPGRRVAEQGDFTEAVGCNALARRLGPIIEGGGQLRSDLALPDEPARFLLR